MKFEEWLSAQHDREDFVGEFARVLGMQYIADSVPKHKGKVDEHRSWADVVIGMVQPGYIGAFNEAWQEFVLAKQAAQKSPE